MNHLEVLSALRAKGKLPSTIANTLKVSQPLITQAAMGKGSRVARLKIAFILEKSPSLIWADMPREQLLVDDDIYYHPHLYPKYLDKLNLS
jgi:hypothetical protein